jgi:hypothetical protein
MRRVFLYFAIFGLSANVVSAASPIYISQIQITGGKNNTGQDFIELFNPNTTSANLKGYRLVKRSQGSQSDTLIKSWSKDSLIPPKSFYLWANSGFITISIKPDITTSATISEDSGVALRFGESNTGAIIDSVAWGKSNSLFRNVSAVNPGANKALFRKDLYSVASAFAILASAPHNSSANDLAAAFGQSQTSQPSSAAKISNPPVAKSAVPASTSPDNQIASGTQVVGEAVVAEAQSSAASPTPAYAGYQRPAPKSTGTKYIILSGAALLALGFVGYQSFLKKKK